MENNLNAVLLIAKKIDAHNEVQNTIAEQNALQVEKRERIRRAMERSSREHR